ncbi:MAG: FAD:protein FMN transferase [Flavobacteriales bacterium]
MSASTILEVKDHASSFIQSSRVKLGGEWLFWAVVLSLSLTQCGDGHEQQDHAPAVGYIIHTGETQGTSYHIKYISPAQDQGNEQLTEADYLQKQAGIDSILEVVDMEFNLWRPASRINEINGLSDSLLSFRDSSGLWLPLWNQVLALNQASQGAFDPTVNPLVELWGFGLSKRQEVNDEGVQMTLNHVGLNKKGIKVDFDNGSKGHVSVVDVHKKDTLVQLDFNGIAQGLTVDLIAMYLLQSGVEHYMVEVGGEVRCGGRREDGESWRIAVDRPIESSESLEVREMQTIVQIDDAAVCTSGNYRKFYEVNGVKRSHTISPFNGYPVDHGLLSVTIHASNAAIADALATACMVLGPENGKAFINAYRTSNADERIEAYFISDQGGTDWEIWETEGWSILTVSI